MTEANKSSTPILTAAHEAELRARGISPEYAAARGVSSLDLKGVVEMLERNGQVEASKKDGILSRLKFPAIPTTGILIEYPETLDGVQRYRLRSDLTSYVKADEEHREKDTTVEIPRYLCQMGVTIAPYVLPDVMAHARDTSVPIAIVEAPLKAVSLTENGIPAIGLGGVLAGAHDRDAAKEWDEIWAHKELRRIDWRGRETFIVFDAGIRSNQLVALGAAYVAEALRKEGANILVTMLPYYHPQESSPEDGCFWRAEDQGPDDLIAREHERLMVPLRGWWAQQRMKAWPPAALGAHELMRMMLEESVEADPVARVRAVMKSVTKDAGESAPQHRARQAEAVAALLKEPFFGATLHVGGDTAVAAVAALTAEAKLGMKAVRSSANEFGEALGKRQTKEGQDAYHLDGGCLAYQGTKLANFNATIVSQVTKDDGDTRSLNFRIEGRLANGTALPEIDVPAAEFDDMDWVTEQWGCEAIVEAEKGTDRRAPVAIKKLSTPSKVVTYAHTGWRVLDGKRVFLLPGGGISKDGKVTVDVDVKLPGYKCPELPASNEEAQEAWWTSWNTHLVADPSVTLPLLATMYLAPLREALRGVPFTTWTVAPTGSYKSTITGLMMCHYGDFAFNNLPGSWYSTATALEAEMACTADVPFPIDNLVPPGQDENEARRQIALATRIVQTVGDGNTRSRCNPDGSRKVQRRPRCVAISTAEILQLSGESTLGRLHVIEGHSRETTNLAELTEAQGTASLLGVAMAGYIQWLAGIENLAAKVNGTFTPLREGLQRANTGHSRTPTSTAMLITALQLMSEYGRSIGVELDADHDGRVYDLMVATAAAQPVPEQKTAVDVFLDALKAMLGGRVVALAAKTTDPRTPTDDGVVRIGWLTRDEVLLDPTETLRQLQMYLGRKWNYTDSELKRQLKTAMVWYTTETSGGNIPVLRSKEATQLTVQRTVWGGKARVWALDRRLVSQETYEGLKVVESDVDVSFDQAANDGE